MTSGNNNTNRSMDGPSEASANPMQGGGGGGASSGSSDLPTTTTAFVSPFSPLFSKVTAMNEHISRRNDAADSSDDSEDEHHRGEDNPTRRGAGGSGNRWFQQLSLNGARKVSIVVRVEPTSTANGEAGGHDDDDDDDDVCLFPLVLPQDRHQQQHQTRRHHSPSSRTGGGAMQSFSTASSMVSSHELVVVNPDAFGSHLKLPAAVTMERARLVSMLSQRGLSTPTKSRTGGGANAAAKDNPTEDWIRSYRFSNVVWSAPASTGAAMQSSSLPPADTDCWVRLCRAMAGDVTLAGSIARRTVVSMGSGAETLQDTRATGNGSASTRKSKVAAALSPSSVSSVPAVPGKTTIVFGTVATESVAHVLAHDQQETAALVGSLQEDPTPVVQRYGLLGLTCCYILQQMGELDGGGGSPDPRSGGESAADLLESQQNNRPRPARRRMRLTLSIFEVADEDVMYDLLKLKPFARESAVQLKHSRSTLGSMSDLQEGGMSAASLVGLTDTPIDSLRTLGRCVRRAFTMAYHARRTKPRGTLVAVLKVWDSSSPTRHTAVQFVDLAQVVPDDGGSFWRESQKPRNARLRQSITALGAALRQVLLKEAGNSTVGSYRQHTLTQVLSRDLGGGTMDSRIVLLANLSALSRNYAETMTTIRFVSSIVTRPGDPLLSPFDKHQLLASGDFTTNDNHTKTTSSPTSRSSGDADDSFLSSASLLDEALQQGALLRSVVADPRQRMAKLVRPSKAREQESVHVMVGASDPYTPTHYMSTDPGEAAAAFARQAEEFAKRGKVAVAANTSPQARTALFSPANYSPTNGGSFPKDSEMESIASPLRGRHIETGFGSGMLERQGDEGGGVHTDEYHFGEPSPLTTDTGGRSTAFDFQQATVNLLQLDGRDGATDEEDDLRSLESAPHVQPRVSTGSAPRQGQGPAAFTAATGSPRFSTVTESNRESLSDHPRQGRTPSSQEGEIRHLNKTIRDLQSQLQRARDMADSRLENERTFGGTAQQELEAELLELRRLSQRKDDDLQRLQRRVDTLHRELETQQQTSSEQVKRLRETWESGGNVLQERLEADIDQLRLAIQSRDDCIADLQSMSETQRRQLQLRLDEALSGVEAERERWESERSVLTQLNQELADRQVEATEKDSALLRLQGELDMAKSELQQSLERNQLDGDEKEKLDALCHQYQEEVDQYRRELSRKEEELQQLNEAVTRERAARELSDGDEVQNLLSELEDARAELERRDMRIRELDAAVEQVESGRQEVLAIADEAIATQAELEKRIHDLESALSTMGAQSVSKEQYEASEEAYRRVSKELQEARNELLLCKSDYNSATVRLAEVQFALQSVEKERDHLAARDSENQRELTLLRTNLQGSKAASEEVERLSVENRRLQDELHQAQSLRSKYELELEHQLAQREEEVERSQEEAALIKDELALVLAEHSAVSEMNEQQILDLRTALEESEHELAKLVDEGNRSDDAVRKELEESRRLMSVELDQLRRNYAVRVSETEDLSNRLRAAQEEKEAALSKAASLKRALASFQDSTRSKVQTFVHHRSETKALLERTLEENDALATQNRQLQAALQDLQTNPVGPMGRELDDALARLSQSRAENSELRSLVQQLGATVESLRDELLRVGPSIGNRASTAERQGDDRSAAAVDLLRSSKDLVESRRLDDLLRSFRDGARQSSLPRSASGGAVGVPPPPPPPPRPSSKSAGAHPSSTELVASIALAAKASVDRNASELHRLQDELAAERAAVAAASKSRPLSASAPAASRSEKVDSLKRRIQVLEGHRAVVDGLLLMKAPPLPLPQPPQPSETKQLHRHGQHRRRRSSSSLSRGLRYEDEEDGDGASEDDTETDADGDTVEGLTRRVRFLERRLEKGWIG